MFHCIVLHGGSFQVCVGFEMEEGCTSEVVLEDVGHLRVIHAIN